MEPLLSLPIVLEDENMTLQAGSCACTACNLPLLRTYFGVTGATRTKLRVATK